MVPCLVLLVMSCVAVTAWLTKRNLVHYHKMSTVLTQCWYLTRCAGFSFCYGCCCRTPSWALNIDSNVFTNLHIFCVLRITYITYCASQGSKIRLSNAAHQSFVKGCNFVALLNCISSHCSDWTFSAEPHSISIRKYQVGLENANLHL